MQQDIERDLKTALLSGNKELVETLKSLKSALQYEAVALKTRPEELDKTQIQNVFAREAKKRQEAITMYRSAGETERANKEEREKNVIDDYLPTQMSEDEIRSLVAAEIDSIDAPSMKDMGKIIGSVKAKAGAGADGSLIAGIVKTELGNI